MGSDYYTPPTANVDGETADANDVNLVSDATLAAFELIEAYISDTVLGITNYAELAQGWAETAEDLVVPTQPAGSYSALHYSAKAQAYATEALGYRNTGLTYLNSTITYAGQASTSADAASASASAASSSASSASSSASSASSSASSAESAKLAAQSAAAATAVDAATCDSAVTTTSVHAANTAANAAAVTQAIAALPSTVLAEGNGATLSVANGVTTVSVARPVGGVLVERATACTVGKFIDIPVPECMDGMTLTSVIMTCTDAGTTGFLIGNIEKNGTDMLSVGVSIDTGETSSTTAATSYTIKTDGTEDVATGDVLTFEITTIHTGTAANGCSIVAQFE